MRVSFSALIAAAALLLGGSSPPAATAAGAPSCAAGPVTVGDTTYGTPCADVIVAPATVATVQGGGGDDTIVPAPIAAAAITSCSGADCFLGIGSQTFEGGPGDDTVFGQRGNDTLRGGEGNDHLFGGIGDDVLRGGPGNDQLGGGFGADSIDGNEGDDYVHGDGTIDRIFDTGGGSDTLSYATGVTPGFEGTVAGFGDFPGEEEGRGVKLQLEVTDPNPEVLNGDNGLAAFGGGFDKVGGQNFETIVGTPFADLITGSVAGQTIYGGGGGDVLLGDGNLDGGADGDYLDGAGSAAQRDPTKVSVGLMTPGAGAYSQLYLTGSNGKDVVTATYSPGLVTFTLTAGAFDQSPSAASGCTVGPTQATCPLATPLDSVLLAGMDGDDTIAAAGFPSTTTLVALGGKGKDSLSGGDASEDVLVDGPGQGAGSDDVLAAGAGDDALLHNGGADQLFGGAGNDLFLSVSICDGEAIHGEADRDNASWARLEGEGAGANLASGLAGEPRADGAPACATGALDSLQEIEDLEGSAAGDAFFGDAGPNQLLGHLGPDVYSAAAGADTILANSGDPDPYIDCGDDIDRALVDHPQYGDAVPVNCEVVREADPNSFQLLPGFPAPIPPPPVVVSPPPARPARDRKPPQTTITARPPAALITHRARRRVVLRFAASERRTTFLCKLDGGPFRPCASPRAYLLPPGRHAIRVRAVDAAGNADPTPALVRVRVRRT